MTSSRANDEQSPLAVDANPVNEPNAPSSQQSRTSPIKPEDNPFIQFRRYADSQVSSFLQSVIGLPSLFTQPSAKARWIAIKTDGDKVVVDGDEVTMRQRKQIEESWKNQKEQDAEARQRAAELRRRQSMREWGWSDETAGEDASIPPRRYPNGDLMPDARPKNVLDAVRKNFGGIMDSLGWDGKQKDEGTTEPQTPQAGGPTQPGPSRPPVDLATAQLDPFSGRTDEAIPWLLRDTYSPIFLRGHLPKDIDVASDAYKHALEHPHWPEFRAASSLDRFKKELRFEVPWCDAFEDLVSLENTGRMIDREEPTRTSSVQWLSDMITRGSLQQDPRVMSKRFGMPASLFASPGSTLLRPSLAELFDMVDQERDSLDEARDALSNGWEKFTDLPSHQTPQVILAAMKKAAETSEQVWEDENGQGFCDNRDDETELAMYENLEATKKAEKSETNSASESAVVTSATSSSSSWTSSTDEQKDSIISTMTTTETRNLPDGSVETRRVLKKRFADGREESNESVETQMPSRKEIRAPEAETALARERTVKQDQGTQTQANGKEGGKGSGWFWL